MSDENATAGKLYAKLAEVIDEVGYVGKDGRNTFQNYDYTSAEALLAAIRKPLSARGVVLMPSLTALSEREYTTSKDKASVITTAHIRFTLIDSESGQQHECDWAGEGDDPADKGLGKAYTNAIKTFLRQQFLIPQGDDPEADNATSERGADRVAGTRQVSSGGEDRIATDKQHKLIFAKAKAAGLSNGTLANIVKLSAGDTSEAWDSDVAAREWLLRAMPKLPARLVNPVLEKIAEGAA